MGVSRGVRWRPDVMRPLACYPAPVEGTRAPAWALITSTLLDASTALDVRCRCAHRRRPGAGPAARDPAVAERAGAVAAGDRARPQRPAGRRAGGAGGQAPEP